MAELLFTQENFNNLKWSYKDAGNFLTKLGYDLDPRKRDENGKLMWTTESIIQEAVEMIEIILNDKDSEYDLFNKNGIPVPLKKYNVKQEETKMAVKLITKNMLDKEGNTNVLCNEYSTLEEAEAKAKYLAEAKSVLAVTIINGTEVTVIKSQQEETKMEEVVTTTEVDVDEFIYGDEEVKETIINEEIKEETEMTTTEVPMEFIPMEFIKQVQKVEVENKEDVEMVTTETVVQEQTAENQEEAKMVETTTKKLTKAEVRKELETLGVTMSNNEFKKTKLADLITKLEAAKNPVKEDVEAQKAVTEETIEEFKEETEMEVENPIREKLAELGVVITEERYNVLSLEDLKGIFNIVNKTNVKEEVTQEEIVTATEEPAKEEAPVVQQTTPKAKMDKFLNILAGYVKENAKKGYGHTTTPYYFNLAVMQAEKDISIADFKEYTMSEEDKKLCNDVYKYVYKKGYIKPCSYTVKENTQVRVYTSYYDGRKASKNNIVMIPVENATGFTKDKVMSYAVSVR